ncbi:thioester reductase domain-containing protein [Flavitalea sp. BT771]|uniref:thioester reductase domain-containing protein n=1 Tax=Flavitalea sp. BT771 TaxID=3063329 RepID=UPI0026E25A3B|nr:thioester reductase domain-containing protein [Flavitalea sp. BT771]MDO6434608.1 thioester reductase domain-containing protein [Flavitalea sp. BT771]MDV6223508.1 thioester reductase domain-containing protein [Flavitalea sp. BT771]
MDYRISFDHKNLVGLLEWVVGKAPDSPALKDSRRSYTYDEVYRTARQAAEKLSSIGARPGDRIVCISRKNAESILLFWAIQCCGGIPVMLDQEDGHETNALKIEAVSPQWIILDKKEHDLSVIPGKRPGLDPADLLPAVLQGEYKIPLDIPVDPLCYILLTSGTSGIPKAVRISHRNVLHYTEAVYERLGRPRQVVAAHVTTFAADLGLTNLCVALAAGGLLRIFNKEEATDPDLFEDILAKERITLLKITPSHLLSMVEGGRRLRQPIDNLVLGGEKLSWPMVKKIFSLDLCRHLYNHYGPTETTIGATMFPVTLSYPYIDMTASVPIGRPLGQGTCFLEGEGVTGELCIGGPGVSPGYLNNEEETRRKFFTRSLDGAGQPFYRTGDICRKLDDDNYEFLYRMDRQVKVNGYRIELGEIELLLTTHPDVENAIVQLSGKTAHNSLEAYVRLIDGRSLEVAVLRNWLLRKVQASKVPSEIYIYTHTPFTSNGKIDLASLKKAFSIPGPGTADASLNGQHTGIDPWEDQVLMAWKKALDKNTIQQTDHFFETGGDSLLAIQMIGRLQRFGYKVHIRDLNRYPIFADFISLRPGNQPKPADFIPPYEDGRTWSQQSFLLQTSLSMNTYCQSILLETENKIHIREMAMALTCVLQGHTQLTARFLSKEDPDNEGKTDAGAWELGTTILDNRMPASLQVRQTTVRLLKEMSIGKGRLFRAQVFVDPAGKDYLYLVCHHLAIDVVSWNIILDELPEYYEQILRGITPAVNPENTVQLFYSYLRHSPQENGRHLPERIPLPVKLPPRQHTFGVPTSTQVCCIQLPEEMAKALRHSDEQTGALTTGDYLLGAFARSVLHELGLQEVSIDVEFHARPDHTSFPDVSRSVAWWSVTLPVNFIPSNTTPAQCNALLRTKAEQARRLNMQPHQQHATTDHADIRFNYLGPFPEYFGNNSLRLHPAAFNPGPTRDREALLEYSLSFTCRFVGTALIADIQYQTPRFNAVRIAALAHTMLDNVRDFLKDKHPMLPLYAPLLLDSNLPSVGQPLYYLRFPHRLPGITHKYVLLTGATGFLGIHLVHELLKYPGIHIYCLVRGENKARAERRFKERLNYYFDDWTEDGLQRVTILKGDLLEHRLGIEETEYAVLRENVDLILHAAADVNLLRDYARLKTINTDPLQPLLDLARSGKQKEIHYVSSLAVSGYLDARTTADFDEDSLDQGQSFISDYERTKFEAEKIVRTFFSQGGKGKIYRTGHIAADSLRGRFQCNPEQNRVYQLIKGMLLLGKIPADYQEKISFSYVDVVARALVRLSLDLIGTDMQCLHLENPQYLSFGRITVMLKQMGYTIEAVDMDTFEEAVAAFDGPPKDREIVHLMRTWVLRSMDFPRKTIYLHGRSLDTLARSGLYFPETDFGWFSHMVRQGIDMDYFHPPALQGKVDWLQAAADPVKNEH